MRLILLVLSAGLTACASDPTAGGTRYSLDRAELAADCRARGGLLVPNAGGYSASGRAALDFHCDNPGGASRLPRS